MTKILNLPGVIVEESLETEETIILSVVVGYFKQRTTNAIVEGINNKLKLLKRSGFGLRNFNNFETRALLFWHFPRNLAY